MSEYRQRSWSTNDLVDEVLQLPHTYGRLQLLHKELSSMKGGEMANEIVPYP